MGQLVIEPKYDQASDFDGGVVAVLVGKKWGLMDKTGQFIAEPEFSWLSDFSNGGLALVFKFEYWFIIQKWGVINNKGELQFDLLPFKDEVYGKYQVGDIHEGLIRVHSKCQ